MEWVYQDGREETWVITKVENRNNAKLVFVGLEVDGKVKPWVNVEVCQRGVYRVWCRGEKDDPPVCWLKLSARAGGGDEDVMTVGEVEEVEVPAGKFRALRVEMSYQVQYGVGLSVRLTTTRWFAPGVGFVEQGDDQLVLKSFTPDKD